ncbi:MAG: class I SAM-dependent methyltransferase [Thermoplasmatales archaeon]|nr:class I SAM-dependent methyltransferase [Thermoplasmatales archaeon]
MVYDGLAVTRPGFDVGGLPPESAAICAEWGEARDGHPFYGERMDPAAVVRFWDGVASDYKGEGRGEMISAVLGTLREMGALNGTVLDVGSGPGTFSLPFAETAEKVVALDSSEKMLDGLMAKADDLGLSNVSTTLIDWNDYVPRERHDLVFSSLCPGANSPASILRMEAASKGKCAYVSSMNRDESVNFEVWRRLGRKYTYHGYNTGFPYRFLRSIGRKPFFCEISWVHTMDIEASELIERTVRSFGIYGNLDGDDVMEATTAAVHGRYGSGRISEDTTLRAGLLVWDVPGDGARGTAKYAGVD